MSPTIFPLDAKLPSHELGLSGEGGGTICAMGSPFRVTRMGWPVFFTLSSNARQVALNFEIVTDHSQ